MDNNATKAKSRQFAVKIAQLYKNLSNNKKEYVMSEELLRVGAGIGVSLAEAECAANKNDFLAKIQEALQKCAATRYWLEILKEAECITEFEFTNNIQDCDELRKILFYTIKSLKVAPAPPVPAASATPGQAITVQPKPPVH
jgi:four helix bundle protein